MLLEDFADYCAQDVHRPLEGEVLHHAKRAVVDWFSALYPGTRLSPGTNLVQAHAGELGVGRSSLPGFGTTAFPATAAWINGSTSHAAEFDDIFRDAIYHPGCPVISAALAIAQDVNRSGQELLRSVVIGYEVSTRIGAAVQPSHYKFFHTTGTAGCFGAAAAGAALLAPGNAAVALHALATSATFASGLQQAFRSDAMTKALHAGNAASVGVRAAMGAAHGVTGVPDMLEGPAGFGAALAVNPDWSRVTEGLGVDYNVTRMSQKNHGCCGHTFAAIDAALEIKQAHAIDIENIRSIRVSTYQVALDVTGNFEPRTAFEGKFSLPYVVCHGLVFGSVRIAAFEAEHLADQRVRKLMTKLSLDADPALTAGFPSMRAARVFITMNDGQVFEHFAPYRKGDPEAPLTDEDLNDKFRELVAPVIGQQRAQILLNQLWRLETLKLGELAFD